jgi:hypothetical protein
MNNNFPDQNTISTSHHALFTALRAELAHEVSGSSAMLADLLERVSGMQEAHARPAEFKDRFDEFVGRAQEHIGVVRPFFPALVGFLPSHLGEVGEPHSPECYARRGIRAGAA